MWCLWTREKYSFLVSYNSVTFDSTIFTMTSFPVCILFSKGLLLIQQLHCSGFVWFRLFCCCRWGWLLARVCCFLKPGKIYKTPSNEGFQMLNISLPIRLSCTHIIGPFEPVSRPNCSLSKARMELGLYKVTTPCEDSTILQCWTHEDRNVDELS